MNSYLLASFIDRSELLSSIELIQKYFVLIENRLFVLKHTADDSKLILTYNVEADKQLDFEQVLFHTIRVHRKKETNTLYSLNALNYVVKLQNNNRLDSSFVINWEEYSNCILTVRDNSLNQINTKLEQIIILSDRRN